MLQKIVIFLNTGLILLSFNYTKPWERFSVKVRKKIHDKEIYLPIALYFLLMSEAYLSGDFMQYKPEQALPAMNDALAKNNKQIAHDLRSPLSALAFLASLNPDMPRDSQELLKMAILRLEDIANNLDKQG